MYCFRYAMSGSLLGVELKGITSAPVGYLSIIRMYPMDFEEFMIANSVSNMTLDILIEMGEKVGRVTYLPIYMSYLLQEPKTEQLIVDLDMSGL